MMKGWKTVSVASLLAVAGIAQQADVATLVAPQYVGAFTTGVAVLMAALRAFTNTPMGKPK